MSSRGAAGRPACPAHARHSHQARPWLSLLAGLLSGLPWGLMPASAQRVSAPEPAPGGLRIHAANPRYLEFRGRPTLLVGSGEHYGALLNPDFDFHRYLQTLSADGLNYTRVFSGAYVEPQGAFNIARNTLAPAPGRLLAPWARSAEPGYAGGGNKFDLARWDPDYFARLRELLGDASRRGIVVELTLFCAMYEDAQWNLSPLNPRNHINGAGRAVGRTNLFTLDRHGGLLPAQEALVRKLVAEVRDFDNVILEICNEPYFAGVSPDWQRHIADVISAEQEGHPFPKPIAQNIANGTAKVTHPHPKVSILNFHYAAPPDAVGDNAGLRRVLGDDETGFRGISDAPYRMEAWDFVVAGGGLFNHLDYSFTVGHEDGSFRYPPTQPGGGNAGFRRQIRFLREFVSGGDLVRMLPRPGWVRSALPAGVSARVLAGDAGPVVAYLRTGGLPRQYSARWTGFLTAPATGEFTLYTRSNDGVRLWVDDRLVIDHWDEHSVAEDRATVRLEKGTRRRLRLEYFYAGGEPAMQLFWSGPGVDRQVVPKAALRTFDGKAGLRGEYFADMTLTARAREIAEGPIDFTGASGGGTKGVEGARLDLALPAGRWKGAWSNPATGTTVAPVDVVATREGGTLPVPAFTEDVVLRLDQDR